MKKIIISLGLIVAAAGAVTGVTIALFNDTETSAGNIFTSGSVDLKVDHVWQTYNDVECKTCSVEIKSDTTNTVVSTVGGDDPVVFPHPAVQVSNPHPAWTVTSDIPGATWIWATDPTTPHDSGNVDVYYTFRKTFEWWGPVTGATLSLGVGTDNGYEVKLNGTVVGTDWGEYNYKTPADVYNSFGSLIQQGTNTLEIKVKNKALSGGTPSTNPAGLLYKLTINGNCGDNYFKTYCRLWGEKDLAQGDTFFNFDDVKPGDQGTNIISLHVLDNDAYSCLLVTDPVDNENVCVDPESSAGDTTCSESPDQGELSGLLSAMLWEDTTRDNAYNVGETIIYGPASLKDLKNMVRLSLPTSQTKYIGLAWCAGTQTVDDSGIHCSGAGNQDVVQTDSFLASLTAFAEQQRNNPNFSCTNVVLQPRVAD